MSSAHPSDFEFAGSIPELYDRYLVPMVFEPYADDLVARLQALRPESVLEVAAGSGVVTRAMAAGLPDAVGVTATDLNQPMLDYARSLGTDRPVEWLQADALHLPFADASFDTVVCQFGVMFFPDRESAFAEAARVLRPGGTFMFSVWDSIEHNEFAEVVNGAVAGITPENPSVFLARTPYGYFDAPTIQADLSAGGFDSPAAFDAVEARSRASSADAAATAFCQGTPLRNEIEAGGASRLAEATATARLALEERFGTTNIEGKMRAVVVTVAKARDE